MSYSHRLFVRDHIGTLQSGDSNINVSG